MDDIKAIRDGTGIKRNRDSVFTAALALDSADAAFGYLLTHEPAHAVTNSQRIHAGLEDAFARKIDSRASVYSGPILIPEGWDCSTHSLLVYGPTGVGKTQWAKTYCAQYHGDFLFARNVQDLRELRPHHNAIIFDDMDFSKFSDSESKNIVDVGELCTVRVLYGTVRIRPGVVRIFTANDDQIFNDKFDAIYGRRLACWEFDQ